MKLQFEPNLDYQVQAVNAVADLFAGQPGMPGLLESGLGIGNRLSLGPEELHANLNRVQLRQGLAPSPLPLGRDFTIEMETGTGKTYVYLRTAFELHRRSGFSKFVIVVPGVAIREGVLKTLEITRDHFGALYPEGRGYSFSAYDSSRLGQVRDFAASGHIRFLVATIQSLYSVQAAVEEVAAEADTPAGGRGRGRAERVIHRPHEQTGGEKPIDLIRAAHPVLIVDEPQSVDGGEEGQGKQALGLLGPLCVLRYSATHLNREQLLYRLDAVDAYQRRLVKQIEVASLAVTDGHNRPYVRLAGVRAGGARQAPAAVLELDVQQASRVSRTRKTVQGGEDLGDVTGRELYRGLRVGEISAARGKKGVVLHPPGREAPFLNVGASVGGVSAEEVARLMIRRTIEEHLQKERRLRPRGVKVLSLFFLDRVENYRSYGVGEKPRKGRYAVIFEEEYARLAGHPEDGNLSSSPEQVHNGYFSADRKGRLKDTSGRTADDADAYQLILRDKERLLDLANPLRFIFSHSALREGWDNPNVFQICVLREVGSERERRQTLGRGLRLAVNQQGERVRDESVNVLTVVANESYEAYAEGLQAEIERDTGLRFGRVEPHSFAAIVRADARGQEAALGVEASAALWSFLQAQGDLDAGGRVQVQLRRALRAGTVRLPPELEPARAGVEAVLRNLAGRLNIRNAGGRGTVGARRAVLDSPEVQARWERLRPRTSSRVQFSSEDLIRACTAALRGLPPVTRTRVQTSVASLHLGRGGVGAAVTATGTPTLLTEEDLALPDILSLLQERTGLTRRTLATVLRQSGRLDDFHTSPQAFIEAASEAIQSCKRALLVEGVRDSRPQEALEEAFTAFLHDVLAAQTALRGLIHDSVAEQAFADELEKSRAVKVYARLPNGFTVPTSAGPSHPEWAVVVEENGNERLYLVGDTRDTLFLEALRPPEQAGNERRQS